MIEFLQGKIIEISPTEIVLQHNGIGFRLQISLNTYDEIQKQKEVLLYTHLYVKHEGQNLSGFELYGFATKEERLYFSTIIAVSGIGVSTARLMLSSLQPKQIARAINLEDVGTITTVKGIGPKTAKRLILELKDKIPQIEGNSESGGIKQLEVHNTIESETLSALVMLGFTKATALKAIRSVTKTETALSVEQMIKLCLKKL